VNSHPNQHHPDNHFFFLFFFLYTEKTNPFTLDRTGAAANNIKGLVDSSCIVDYTAIPGKVAFTHLVSDVFTSLPCNFLLLTLTEKNQGKQ